jgi:ribosome biogenesis GTPase
MNHDEKKLKRQLQEMQIGHAVKKEQRKSAKVRRAMSTGSEEERFDARAVLGADAETLADLAPRTRVRTVRARVAAPSSARPAQASDTVGTVSAVFPGACRVRLGSSERDCRLAPTIAVDQRHTLAVGDAVRVSEQGDVWRVEEVLPRRTRLARADPSQPGLERVLAANVDIVLIATAFVAPGVKPGLIDRVLLAAREAGCEALVCVNKLDLLRGGERAATELALLAPYGERGVEVFQCSARTGEGLDRLQSRLAGSTAVLVGQSGCGKTSLLNALVPGIALATGASRASDGKGRHTTTASSLHALAHGGFLIDTPGVRQWGLWDAGGEALEAAFPDVFALAASCRFRDCAHGGEPGCAVRAAVARGDLAASRLVSYERLRAGAEED